MASGDGFEVTLFGSDRSTVLGAFDTLEAGTPLFWGFISSADIGRVSIRPRLGNGFIGLDALSTVAVPEPGAAALVAGLLALGTLARRRRPS